MPRTCTVCRSPDRASVEKELLRGTPCRVIALRFNLNHDSVRRHHMNDMVVTDEFGIKVVWSLAELRDPRRSLAERAELVDVLLDRALQPLTTHPNAPIDLINTNFVAALLRIQQADDYVMLKAMGLLKDDTPAANAAIMAEQLAVVSDRIEGGITRLIEAGYSPEKARATVSYMLNPRPELQMGREAGEPEQLIDTEWGELDN